MKEKEVEEKSKNSFEDILVQLKEMFPDIAKDQYIAPGGQEIVINYADFKSAISLEMAFKKRLAAIDYSGSISKDILHIITQLLADQAIVDAVFKCLKRCEINGQIVTEERFEDVKNRELLYDLQLGCVYKNLYPFFKTLFSRLKINFGMKALSSQQ